MPISFVNNSATIGTTEFSLPSNSTSRVSQTDDCLLQTWIDFANLAAGDEYRVRLYEKVNAGTERIVEQWSFVGAQARPAFVMPTTIVGEGWDVTVIKIAGTDRSIAWSLRKVT